MASDAFDTIKNNQSLAKTVHVFQHLSTNINIINNNIN